MKFPSYLTQAVLLKRYKRFLAEVVLNHQEHRIIYCPNMGAMRGCDVLGSRVWFSHDAHAHKKYPDTWELVEVDAGYLVCINIAYANQLVMEAIQNGVISELQSYQQRIQKPWSLAESGFDLLLENTQQGLVNEKCFIVVNSVTLGDEIKRGFFPDFPTEQAIAKLKSLIYAKQLGYRAVLLFCALNTGIERIFPADYIDLDYGCILRQAMIAGVEILGFRVDISFSEIKITTPIEVCIPARLIANSKPEKSN